MLDITRRLSRIRGRRAAIGAAVACTAALAAGGTAAADIIFDFSPPTDGTTRYYQTIQAKHSGLYLNVPEASTANGTQIIQWNGKHFMNGQWEWVYGPGDHLGLRNRWSRQCLDVDSKTDGAPVVQRPCDGSISQSWTYNSGQQSGDENYRNITNAWSKLDLNIAGASTALGAKLVQYHHVQGAPNAMFGGFFGITPTVD
jgi:Ricin-type beta-trefoil lectin domain-like